MSLNRAELIGRLTRDPEMRYTPSGQPVTNFSIATSHYTKSAAGERQEHTDYHNIVCWNAGNYKLAEWTAANLVKGSLVYVEGRLQTRKFEVEPGHARTTTEVVARDVQALSGARQKATA